MAEWTIIITVIMTKQHIRTANQQGLLSIVSNIKENRLFYFYSPAVTTVKEPKIDFSLKYSICCWQLKSILLNNYTYSKKVKKKFLHLLGICC